MTHPLSEAGTSVEVKPLEWAPVTDQIPKHAFAAYTPFTRWLIVCEFLSMNHMVYRFADNDYETLDEAKAAAQADFNARILSALIQPTPAETEGEEQRRQVFTYEHSPSGAGNYVTTISNDPPPPNLWCRVKKFTPASAPTPPPIGDGERPKPIAFAYEIATNIDEEAGYGGWRWELSFAHPMVPNDGIKNVEALYPASAIEALRAERDANGQEAFTLRNQLQDARRDAAKWLKLHNEQEARAEQAEAQVSTLSRQLEEAREAAFEECAVMIQDLADAWRQRPPLPASDGEWPTQMVREIRRRAKETVSHG